ncbi:2-amino-4-hydroxy-6-hydroxymethyldihydropteridine diphosphokinase [Luteimonas yindakuii]|uniref:2-amino-4-hydroxy-6-hydroxymethyldihydropteridine pyrophosphokinase n=1 Tax=Luteimonas yindakuii TaxID=2565782 RepID=A0A4Z1R6V8_9GAMM|nr:2-amino-4-hydroxy-6-hydroxymethyldihydropteridine diphosphokinase [Luteimonas yindakuii]TKS54285.1 2-amino-4-hydroxy-6-hydroxymethyldihydropteridine diphosphokinase [Luteimonas yindakuii]
MSAPSDCDRSPGCEAAIGLGANLGDPVATLRSAFDALAALPGTRLLAASPLYRSAAWGRQDQPPFVNAVARLHTRLEPDVLLEALLRIEAGHGRVRADDPALRWGPRLLDLDLLLYGARRIDTPGLRVPHPHLHERAFALRPLLDVWPDAAIPGLGPARDLLPGVDEAGVVRLDDGDDRSDRRL